MPPHGYFGFDIDRFCSKLVHEGPDAIVYADSSGLILFWNHGAERIFGYSAKEAIGSSLDLIMPENLRARHWAAYRETMRTGKTRYGEGDVLAVPALGKGGRRISIEFTIFSVSRSRRQRARCRGNSARCHEALRRDKSSTQGSGGPASNPAKPLIGLKRLSGDAALGPSRS